MGRNKFSTTWIFRLHLYLRANGQIFVLIENILILVKIRWKNRMRFDEKSLKFGFDTYSNEDLNNIYQEFYETCALHNHIMFLCLGL
ncbi:hypothetical protein H5410_035587 [Solanum commersonii]|uniref:Uncharacterized protein n=1 Tax=Solanum commersonii TaxID=4109 RepID=A0A9J5Y139_SOLCO|nr:hypothetical protein H5410_035587 [Solanum commersonii]